VLKQPKCEKITEQESKQISRSLFKFSDFVRALYMIDRDDIEYSEDSIQKIVDLVFKRKFYFRAFHDVEEINELKEISLYCFWILKLQPFYWAKKGRSLDDSNFKLNSKFALGIFLYGVRFYAEQTGNGFNWSERIIKDLSYSFSFRDWSKEALMDLAQSFIIEPHR
jgi:hypothetical protein